MGLDRRWLDPRWVLGEASTELRLVYLGILVVLAVGLFAFFLSWVGGGDVGIPGG